MTLNQFKNKYPGAPEPTPSETISMSMVPVERAREIYEMVLTRYYSRKYEHVVTEAMRELAMHDSRAIPMAIEYTNLVARMVKGHDYVVDTTLLDRLKVIGANMIAEGETVNGQRV